MQNEENIDRVKRRRRGKSKRRRASRPSCTPVRISRGPMSGRYRNPCTGKLARTPRRK